MGSRQYPALFAGMATDINYTKTMGVKIIEGKDFFGFPLIQQTY
jgi:hypothetical protein